MHLLLYLHCYMERVVQPAHGYAAHLFFAAHLLYILLQLPLPSTEQST